MSTAELAERWLLIEESLRQGRRSLARWGWVFVLWGVGHITAAAWSLLAPGSALPWIVAMPVCGVVMVIGALMTRRRVGKTTELEHVAGGIWWAFGVSLALTWGVGGSRGLFAGETFLFVFYVLVGAASFASGTALKLREQRVVGGLWWAFAVAHLFAPLDPLLVLMLSAVVCEVGFGLLLMRTERDQAG